MLPLITGIDLSCQQGFVFTDSLTCILDGHVGELPDGQVFLPANIAVSMLEKLPTTFTDPQL